MSESKMSVQQLQMRVTKLRWQFYWSISHEKALLLTKEQALVYGVIMKGANTAVEKVLEYEQHEAEGRESNALWNREHMGWYTANVACVKVRKICLFQIMVIAWKPY